MEPHDTAPGGPERTEPRDTVPDLDGGGVAWPAPERLAGDDAREDIETPASLDHPVPMSPELSRSVVGRRSVDDLDTRRCPEREDLVGVDLRTTRLRVVEVAPRVRLDSRNAGLPQPIGGLTKPR